MSAYLHFLYIVRSIFQLMVSWFRQERLYAASCYILLMELSSVLSNFVSECKAHVRMQVVVDTLGSKEKRHFAILFDRHQLILLIIGIRAVFCKMSAKLEFRPLGSGIS